MKDNNFGFVRVAAAIPEVRVADCEYNASRIIGLIKQAGDKHVQFLVFPELSITAYTCGDLFHQRRLLDEALVQLQRILEASENSAMVILVGLPVHFQDRLYNCAAVLQSGNLLGIVPKSYIPNHGEFYEGRWFSSGNDITDESIVLFDEYVPFGTDFLFTDSENEQLCFGVEIGEDLSVPIPPSTLQSMAGAMLNFNLSASHDLVEKNDYRKALILGQSAKCISAYVYASAGTGESTTDLIFGGSAIIAENGILLNEAERFSNEEQLKVADVDIERLIADRMKNNCFKEADSPELFSRITFETQNIPIEKLERKIDAHPFVPSNEKCRDNRSEEIFAIQTAGLAKRMRHTGSQTAVIGVSGGLDSTLALLVTVKTFDLLKLPRKNIISVTMPGFGTTSESYKNAQELMKALDVTIREIDIKEACETHFKNIGHDMSMHNSTFENVQARERTQVLMDIANMERGLVVGTGNLSEAALGWSTYNGDHMSMYSVNCSIPKTLVRYLVTWVADNESDEKSAAVLRRILSLPASPELLPTDKDGRLVQITEDVIGPYELHDFFLYNMVRYGFSPHKILFLAEHAFDNKYDSKTIKKWLKVFITRFFSQQFKRSCSPDGPKVGTVGLSPRNGWHMPSDASAAAWLNWPED